MPRGQRISVRNMLIAWWPACLIVAAEFIVAWQFVEPAPPDSVVIVTGAEDGAGMWLDGVAGIFALELPQQRGPHQLAAFRLAALGIDLPALV